MSRAKTWRSNTAGAEGRYDRLPALTADPRWPQGPGDRDEAAAPPVALAAEKAQTSTIPIVFSVGDPVESGLVASLCAAGRQT